MPKIAIDIRWMVGNVRGMGRYASQFIDPVKDKTLGFAPDNCQTKALPFTAVGNSFFPWWEQIVLPTLVDNSEIDYIICPYNTAPIKQTNAQLILIVHDLIFLKTWSELPPSISIYQTLGRIYRRLIVPKVIKKANVLVTVSEFTKQEIIHRFNIKAKNIHVIPNAINSSWFMNEPLAIENRENYLLTVAGEAPSKNVNRLIEAFSYAKSHLPDQIKLKIVGIKKTQHEKFKKIAFQFNILENIEFVNFVSDDELRTLYQNSRAFVFASLYEGFGIPLIEAMASGAPIACSNTTSIPEVVADSAILFNPFSIEEIKHSIITIVNDKDLSSSLVIKGVSRAKIFEEKEVANKFKEFWESIDEK